MNQMYVDRVKKLLRLARDKAASSHEAAEALKRALALIEKHKIDIAEMDLDAATEAIVKEATPLGKRVSLIKKLMGCVIETYFPVRVCMHRGGDGREFSFVGQESDVQIAIYAFHFLAGACQRNLRDYIKGERRNRRVVNASKSDSFVRGWVAGVCTNLQQRQQCVPVDGSATALVLARQAAAVDQFFQKAFPSVKDMQIKPQQRASRSARVAGWMAGRDTSVTTPLNGSKTDQLCLQ